MIVRNDGKRPKPHCPFPEAGAYHNRKLFHKPQLLKGAKVKGNDTFKARFVFQFPGDSLQCCRYVFKIIYPAVSFWRNVSVIEILKMELAAKCLDRPQGIRGKAVHSSEQSASLQFNQETVYPFGEGISEIRIGDGRVATARFIQRRNEVFNLLVGGDEDSPSRTIR